MKGSKKKMGKNGKDKILENNLYCHMTFSNHAILYCALKQTRRLMLYNKDGK